MKKIAYRGYPRRTLIGSGVLGVGFLALAWWFGPGSGLQHGSFVFAGGAVSGALVAVGGVLYYRRRGFRPASPAFVRAAIAWSLWVVLLLRGFGDQGLVFTGAMAGVIAISQLCYPLLSIPYRGDEPRGPAR